MKKFLLPLLLVAALAAGALMLRQGNHPGPATPQAAAPTEAPLKTTGVYADDWVNLCGPLQGAEQAKCTEKLDAAYGRKAGVPVGK
ncbi:MAG TPA: hypothetical protein VL974_08065 [Magnetospirillum sp.]|nr:hypothetical protein [Magnetospirillum sp.]